MYAPVLVLAMFAVFLTGPVIGPPIAQEGGPPEPQQNQTQVKPEFAYITVANLGVGGGGWITKADVVIDHDLMCWIKSDAKVRRGAAAATGIQVSKTSAGLTLTISGKPEWEAVPRSSIASGSVIPCFGWKNMPLELDVEVPPIPLKKPPAKGIDDKGVF